LNYSIDWRLSGNPFLTQKGILVDAVTKACTEILGITPELSTSVTKACTEILGITPELSTSGGTSDGRFIAPAGTEVVELGPCNASIHQIDEHVKLADPVQLAKTYQRILELITSTDSKS
jgi:succinyl-diaminopimelate desuccinylase